MPFGEPCRSACTMVESLITWNNWSRRSCWSGALCQRSSLITVSTSGDVACRLSYKRMVDILNLSSTRPSCRHLYSTTLLFFCIRYNRWTICGSLKLSVTVCVSPVMFIMIKFASHQFLLYVVYMCQKSLNFTYAFKCYHQNVSWPHFNWTTLYIGAPGANRFWWM